MPKTSKDIMYLDQLFRREAHELHQDEGLLAEALAHFRDAASNPLLSELLESARRETLAIAAAIGEHLHGKPVKTGKSLLRGILDEGRERARAMADGHLTDAQLIATMQRLLGYQLAGYESAATFARLLGDDGMEDVLERALKQKHDTVEDLSDVALHQVHWRASWWSPEHTSSWDRVKAAFRRDWEQTKAHLGAAPPLPEGEQRVGDTVAQMTGRQTVVPGTFEADEPAFRYGYGAAQHYRDRDWDDDLEDELRANYGGRWNGAARDNIRAGWDYARPHPADRRRLRSDEDVF